MNNPKNPLAWLFLACILTGINFVYQVTTVQNYEAAIERSIFQCVALLIAYLWFGRGGE